MWGTDGARVLTVDDGWVWTFAAVDHWPSVWDGTCARSATVSPSRSRKGSGAAAARSRRTRPAACRSCPARAGMRPVVSRVSRVVRSTWLPRTRGDGPARDATRRSGRGELCPPHWPIARHSRPAKITSYAKPRSPNLCPRNRVRYRTAALGLCRRSHADARRWWACAGAVNCAEKATYRDLAIPAQTVRTSKGLRAVTKQPRRHSRNLLSACRPEPDCPARAGMDPSLRS